MLTHAELEHYFEDRALEIAVSAYDLWINNAKPSNAIIHLLCNITGEQKGLPKKLGTSDSAKKVAGKSVAQFKHVIAQNHGIRISNLLEILLPVGVNEADIDPAWLSTTDGFGASRGATAHSAAVAYSIDPQDDFKTVNQIMIGVREIDVLLNSIKRTLR